MNTFAVILLHSNGFPKIERLVMIKLNIYIRTALKIRIFKPAAHETFLMSRLSFVVVCMSASSRFHVYFTELFTL